MQTSHATTPGLRPFKLLQIANHFRRALILAAVRFPRATQARIAGDFQQWASQVLSTLQIQVQSNRTPATAFTGLVVSNHLSWLDILVLQSLIPGIFVAKKEVRGWPVVGYLTQACSTIFVDRSSMRSAWQMVDLTADAIQRGGAVVVFPEGTSSDGGDLGNFHTNIFESAVRAGCAVQLVTLKYIDTRTGKAATDAHYIGDMTFASSLWRVLGNSSITAHVHIGDCIESDGHSRKTLAQQAYKNMRSQLGAKD